MPCGPHMYPHHLQAQSPACLAPLCSKTFLKFLLGNIVRVILYLTDGLLLEAEICWFSRDVIQADAYDFAI